MKTKNPKVGVIILNWNGKEILEKCLDSLKKTDYDNMHVLVVDNASTDGSVDMVKKNYPWVEVLELDKNYGFAKGNNEGVRYFMRKYGDMKYVVLLNNDIEIIDKKWLKKIVNFAEKNKNIGIVGCKLLYPDGKIQHAGGYMQKSIVLGLHYLSHPLNKEYWFPEYVCAACMLIKSEIIKKIGLFDEIYSPAYYEDADFCYRVKRLGYRVACYLNTEIIHYEGYSSKKRKNEINVLRNRNKYIFAILNIGVISLLPILFTSIGYAFKTMFCIENYGKIKYLKFREKGYNKIVECYLVWKELLKIRKKIIISKIKRRSFQQNKSQ